MVEYFWSITAPPGFAMNTLGVMEKNTVVRLAIQVENLDTLVELNRLL